MSATPLEGRALPRGTSFVPENDPVFRLAQLLLLLDALRDTSSPSTNLERLAYYDFFSANPYLVVTADDRDRSQLVMAGFDDRALAYASSGQRFTSRRERLQRDLSLLVAYGLADAQVSGGAVRYGVTTSGMHLASRFTALYARGYTASVSLVVRRLRPLSDRSLRESARSWLRVDRGSLPEAVLDLFDSAGDIDVLVVANEPSDP